MAQTIDLAGSGSKREWLLNSAAHFVGLSTGAMVSFFLVAALMGQLSIWVPREILVAAVILIVGVSVLREAGVPRAPVPYRARQVPEAWRRVLPLRLAAFCYGGVLGLGFVTPFVSSAHLAVSLALPLANSVPMMLTAALLFAAGKSVILLLGKGASTHAELLTRFSRKESSARSRVWTRRLVSMSVAILVLNSLPR